MLGDIAPQKGTSVIKGISNSITATLHERINSPLYGTYIFAWLVYNWDKALLLAFSDSNINDRVSAFKASVTNDQTGFDWLVVLVPLAVTGFILICQPYVQRWIFVHNESNKAKGFERRDEFTAKTRLSHEQSAVLRASIRELNKQHEEELQAKDLKVIELQKSLKDNDSLIEEFHGQEEDLHQQIRKAESETSKYKSKVATLSDKVMFLTEDLELQTEKATNSILSFEILNLMTGALAKYSGHDKIGRKQSHKIILSSLENAFDYDHDLAEFKHSLSKGKTEVVIHAGEFNEKEALLFATLYRHGLGAFSLDMKSENGPVSAIRFSFNAAGMIILEEVLPDKEAAPTVNLSKAPPPIKSL